MVIFNRATGPQTGLHIEQQPESIISPAGQCDNVVGNFLVHRFEAYVAPYALQAAATGIIKWLRFGEDLPGGCIDIWQVAKQIDDLVRFAHPTECLAFWPAFLWRGLDAGGREIGKGGKEMVEIRDHFDDFIAVGGGFNLCHFGNEN